MSDVNANIGINIDASSALAELKQLQRQLALFHSQVAKGSAASAAAQKNLQTNLLNAINATGKFTAQMGLVRTSTESFTDALENNKLSMGQYFRFAGGATKSFGRLFKNEFDTIGKVAEERVKKMQTQYIKMGRDANGAMKAMAITPKTLNMKDTATQTALAAQKQAIFNQLVKQGSTELLNFGKNTQWAGRQLMVGFTVPLMYFGTVAGKTFMELEEQAIRFKRVYGDMFTSNEETNKALTDIQNLAKEFTKYGVAVVDTMRMAADAAATGKSGADLTAQVAEATRLAVLGGVEQQQALETTISLTNAFGIASKDLKKDIDFLNAVENQTVTNIEDLTIAIPKAGPVVKQLGGDVQDLAFFLTAMKEGGINASEGANALKSGLASLINPTKKASEMLAGYGINIKAIVEGNAGNLKETVVDFAQALNELAPLDRARAIEQLFGKFQFARLSTLFQNITSDGTQAARVLDLTTKSVEELAILSERELKKVEDAVGTNFKASIEQLKLAIAPIGKTFLEAVTPIIKSVANLFDKFNNLGDGTKKFIVILTTLVGLVGPTLLMTFGLLANGVANIIKLFLALRTGFLKLTGDSKSLGATTTYLTQEQLEAETVAASLNQAHSRLTQQFELEAVAVAALRKAYIDATAAASRFAAANPGMMAPGKGGKVPKKFADGATYVPGTGNKDTVASMLTPGEAVIPKDVAQDPRFQPIIDAMVRGDLKGFNDGTTNVGKEDFTHVGKSEYKPIADLLTEPGLSDLDRSKLGIYADFLEANGYPAEVSTRHNLGFSFSSSLNRGMANPNGVPYADFEKEWLERGPAKWGAVDVPPAQAQIVDDAIIAELKARGATNVTDDLVREVFENLPESVKGSPGYQKMWKKYTVTGSYTLGKGLSDVPEIIGSKIKKGIAAKKLGDFPVVQIPSDTVLTEGPAKGLTIKEAIQKRLYTPPANQHTIITRPEKGNAQVSGIYMADQTGKAYAFGKGSGGQRNDIKVTQDTKREGKIAAAKTGELVYDTKTGKTTKITEQNTKPKKAGVKTTTRKPKDRRVIKVGKNQVILPGADTGLDINGNPLPPVKGGVTQIPFSDVAEQTRVKQSELKQADAIDKNIDATEESTKSTKKFTSKLNTGINVFAGLSLVGSMAGGKIGELSQKIVPFTILLSSLAMMGPSLKSGFTKLSTLLVANPYILLVAAVAATAMSFKVIDDRNKKMARTQSDYIDEVSATTEKMKKVGEITGKVGASEIMARRREGGTADKFTTGFERAGQQFGTNFLESDVGKSIYETFKTNLAKGGSDSIKTVALELSAYVSDGLMTAEDANSVARSIGINLSDMTISANLQGELRQILGPDGQDLANNPIVVRLKIAQESQNSFNDILKEFANATQEGTAAGRGSNFAASLAASGTQALEIVQAQRDAQNKLYDDQIRTLQAQLLTTTDKKKQLEIEQKIATLTGKQSEDDAKLAGQRSKAINAQINGFKKIQQAEKGGALINKSEGAFFTSLDRQITQKYKNDPLAGVFLDTAKATKSKTLEVTIKTLVGSGDLTPNAGTKLIEMFGKDKEAELQTLLTTTLATKDPGKVQELINLATGIKGKKGKDIGLRVLTEIGAKGQEGKFDDRLAALAMLQKMDGKEFNLALYLKDPDNAVKKIDELVPLLNAIEKKKTINKKILLDLEKTPGMPELDGLINDWEYYVNLPDDVKKTVTETYVTIRKSITDDNVSEMAKAEAAKRGLRGRSAAAFISQYGKDPEKLAAKLNRELYKSPAAPNTIPGGGGGGGGAGERDTTLDNLLNRLKMVRDASINAAGGLKELQRVAGGDGVTKFSGVINQLMTGMSATAKNREFISFLESMDNDTRKTYMTVKNGTVELTKAGKDLAEVFNEKTLGDFNTAQVDTVTQTLAQQSAFVKLKSAGVDTATALQMVADAELAIAINASVEPANRLKDMATRALEAKNAVEGLNLAFKQSMSSSVQELEMLKKLPDLVDQMNALGMNGEQIQAVLNNPDFAREMLNGLKDGKLISKDLVDYINSIPARKTLQLKIDMKTPEGMQGIFDKAMGNAQEYFNTLEAAIQLKFKQPMKAAQKAVEDAQKAVQDVQDEINAIQDSIDAKQRSIEVNITRKIEDYQMEIDGIQQTIKAEFDKPIDVLNEESNVLSHDLSLMDKAAEGINEKYDTQATALSKIAEINSKIAAQQKQQLTLADALTSGDISAAAAAAQDMRATQAADQISSTEEALAAARDLELANLRNNAGQTRAQIEERQWQISEQIYSIEQGRKVLQDQIVAIEETKIAPLNKQKVIAEREIRDLEDSIRVIQVGKLANAEKELDKKQEALDKLQEELNKELDLIDAQRDKWLEAQSAIDVARVKSEAFAKSMEYNVDLVKQLAAAWASVKPTTGTGAVTGNVKVDPAALKKAQDEYDAAYKSAYSLRGVPGMSTVSNAMIADFNKKYPNGRPMMYGGMVKPMAYGGRVGSDSVSALLTPGEFVMNKSATKAFRPMLEAMNGSKYPSMVGTPSATSYPTVGSGISSALVSQTYPSMNNTTVSSPFNSTSVNAVNDNSTAVYNYSVGINVTGSNSSPDEIARAVMTQIKTVDAQRIRNQRA